MVSEKRLDGFSWAALEGAIFDMDGTLVDSMEVWRSAGSVYVQSCGFSPEKNLAAKLYPLTIIEISEYLQKHYGLKRSADEIIQGYNGVVEDAYKTSVPLKPFAAEFLQLLYKRSIPMFIATATDRYLAEIVLKRLNIEAYFKGIITSTEAGLGKNESPVIFDIALKKLNTPRNKTIVFEDALHAIKTAKNAAYPIAALYDAVADSGWECIKQLANWYSLSFKDYLDALK